MLNLRKSVRCDLGQSQNKEWIVTNGIGGYASSTVAGMNTGLYHGLLVAATTPPVGRLVLLSKLEDAGLQRDAALVDRTLDQWKFVLNVNLTGQFLCAREAAREFYAGSSFRTGRPPPARSCA
jgi:glycogen debranching enzyme